MNQAKQTKLPSHIFRLKILISIWTILFITYLVIIYANTELWLKLNSLYRSDMLFTVINITLTIIIMWYNWSHLPIEKEKKIENTWMILFLGIIGIWLWLPNKKEISEMTKDVH